MLRLRQQISSSPVSARGFIRDDDGFGGAGQAVNAHRSEHLLFCQGDEQVAGTDDLIHGLNGFSAVRQRGNGLRAADGVDLIHTGDGRGGQDHRVDFTGSAFRRGDHHDLFHTRNPRGNSGH